MHTNLQHLQKSQKQEKPCLAPNALLNAGKHEIFCTFTALVNGSDGFLGVGKQPETVRFACVKGANGDWAAYYAADTKTPEQVAQDGQKATANQVLLVMADPDNLIEKYRSTI